MRLLTRGRFRMIAAGTVVAASAALLAGCGSSPQLASGKGRSKEYFSEREYGVSASPRVSLKRSNLPRGGGRDQLGKPYKVKGKWYYPKEDPDYEAVGAASWYGDAFHGRLTANGEIYDMTHLTAAHPTMPLPSYARVTNLNNGSSVIVRVNDRGPFARGRVIDLSKRAAELLDYTHAGVAKVKVDYVGRAPLDGHDGQYLMASYRPGDRDVDPGESIATGVMIAMNGPTPSAAVGAAFPGQLTAVASAASAADLVLPAFGPMLAERPFDALAITVASVSPDLMSYADKRVNRAVAAFAAVDKGAPMTSADVIASWKRGRQGGEATPEAAYVAVGTYAAKAEAVRMAESLASAGRVEIVAEPGEAAFTVNLHADGRMALDDMLRSAWASGATDAMSVRD